MFASPAQKLNYFVDRNGNTKNLIMVSYFAPTNSSHSGIRSHFCKVSRCESSKSRSSNGVCQLWFFSPRLFWWEFILEFFEISRRNAAKNTNYNNSSNLKSDIWNVYAETRLGLLDDWILGLLLGFLSVRVGKEEEWRLHFHALSTW